MDNQFFLTHLYEKRKTGESATSHLYAVKKILEEAGVNENTILTAALFHDIFEDTLISKDYIAHKLGDEVTEIIELCSKDEYWNTAYCRMKSNLDEMESCWRAHPEPVLIKMADRLHNLLTIRGFIKEKQLSYVKETEQLLIPLFEKVINTTSINSCQKPMKYLLKKIKAEIINIENNF